MISPAFAYLALHLHLKPYSAEIGLSRAEFAAQRDPSRAGAAQPANSPLHGRAQRDVIRAKIIFASKDHEGAAYARDRRSRSKSQAGAGARTRFFAAASGPQPGRSGAVSVGYALG